MTWPLLSPSPVWAVHIADGVLTGPWLLAGFGIAACLAARGAVRIRDEEIPRVALLAAVFFVASSIHIRIGPTSVHLLGNGLLGAVLGWRAALAIPLGLFLQAALIGHGAYSTLGVNTCVLVLPALLAGGLFERLRRVPWVNHPGLRACLVVASAAGWLVSLIFSLALLANSPVWTGASGSLGTGAEWPLHPLTLTAVALLAAGAVWLERYLDHPPEFPLGLIIGVLTVLLTLGLNTAALATLGAADWHALALVVFVAHLPVALVEGTVLGFVVCFLARVQPHLFGAASSPSAQTLVGRSSVGVGPPHGHGAAASTHSVEAPP